MRSARSSQATWAALALCACSVSLRDPVGAACDATRGCGPGELCAGYLCRAEGPARDCAPSDAGVALAWSQCRDGFTLRDPALAVGAGGSADALGLGRLAASARVPLRGPGVSVRGWVTVSAAAPADVHALLRLRAGPLTLAELALNGGRWLGACAPNTVGANELSGSSPQSLALGTRTAIELLYRPGNLFSVRVNGAQVAQTLATGPPQLAALADTLELGLLAPTEEPAQVRFEGFELLADPP